MSDRVHRKRATVATARKRTSAGAHPRLLDIYLNDHLAGANGGVDLARRLAQEHRETAVGEALEPFAVEVAEDRAALLEIMDALGIAVSRMKACTAWILEKFGRLKPNGRFLELSPLSSLVELEAMRLGVEGKAAGWRTLRMLAAHDSRIDDRRLGTLLARARRQARLLEALHAQIAETSITAKWLRPK